MMSRLGRHLTARPLLLALLGLLAAFAPWSRPGSQLVSNSVLARPLTEQVGGGASASSGPAAAASLVILTREGRRTLPVTVIGDQPMVPLEDLSGLFHLTVREEPLASGLTVTYQGRTLALATETGLVSAGGRLIQLTAPPVRRGRHWFVPLDFIGRALPLIYDQRVELRRAAGLVLVGEVRVPHVTARIEPPARLVVDIVPPVPHTITEEPGRLAFRLEAPAVELVPPRLPEDLVSSVRLGETPNTVVFDLAPRVVAGPPATELGERATRVAVALTVPAPSEPGQPTPAAPAEPAGTDGLDTVVIDPGHGGEEPGARGPGGTLEKDVTLAVARRVKALIESRLGWRVLLTRTADETVDLDARAAIANNNKADVFVSLHANASVRPSVAGAEVFYLSAEEYAADPGHSGLAVGDEVPVAGGGSRRIDIILWELAQLRHLEQSALLAGLVEEELRQRITMSPRAVQQAPFRVLAGANMPAVLVELGFLTNPSEERRLASDDFQARAAQALVTSLVRFRDLLQASRDRAVPTSAGGVR